MREIKFRGIYKEFNSKKVFVGDTWGPVEGGFSRPSSYSNATRIADERYSGLKDKNGREIFEGDILEAYNQRLWVVKFGLYSSMNNGNGNGFYLHEISKINFDFICPFYQATKDEIIGTIHENPELLNPQSTEQSL